MRPMTCAPALVDEKQGWDEGLNGMSVLLLCRKNISLKWLRIVNNYICFLFCPVPLPGAHYSLRAVATSLPAAESKLTGLTQIEQKKGCGMSE